MKSLPVRPSLESLRKQAKTLARDRSLSLREAQLAVAREYGFPGWPDLIAEVHKRLGESLPWAVGQARRIIHDNDLDALKALVAQHPELLSWGTETSGNENDGSLLELATGSYADSFDPGREEIFTRGTIAEWLIDAGALVTARGVDGILQSRARGLLDLFRRKGLLPSTLKYAAALGDIEAVRAHLEHSSFDIVYEAFIVACGYQHEAIASLLLDRMIALDSTLGTRVDGSVGRAAFVRDFIANRGSVGADSAGPWEVHVMRLVMHAVDGEATELVEQLRRESWLLGDAHVAFQEGLIVRATLHDRGAVIEAFLDLDPAILRRQPPPRSQAIEFACTYKRTHLIPLLERIWPLPDDLPHSAAMGSLARVQQWFDATGAPALGDLDAHYPWNDSWARAHLQWNPRTPQQVLDVALAWSVINDHFDVADFLLARGADINTNWGSHEPASIMHELVGQVGTGENPPNYPAMQFLIDRGFDLGIRDHRWRATAHGWALHAARDETMAAWLKEAERTRAT